MIYEHKSYRTYLKSVLADRMHKNPSYSLRAMAKSLGIQSSYLSALHKGNKNLALQTAVKIAERLGLTTDETEYFCLLVQYENAPTLELKDSLFSRLKNLNTKSELQDLSVDAFKMIADWYHIAILEMTDLDGFEFNAKNIAEKLKITVVQAEVAIERLERLELLVRDENESGRYCKTVDHGIFRSHVANSALRKFHKQMLAHAVESIDTQTNDEKYIGSRTFPIDVSQLDEARAILRECQNRLVALFEDGKNKTEVYHLGMQLFNLGRKENEK